MQVCCNEARKGHKGRVGLQATDTAAEGAPNHPQAVWMGLIAGISHNMVIGCLIGSFSVMLASVEQRMDVTREMSTAAGPLVILGSAVFGSLVGELMARYSLRLLMFIGACLSVMGYIVLAFTTSYPLYLGTYLLLFGPSMAIAGSIGPATLVTRWFSRNRGLALGLVHLSIVVAIMPLLCNWVLENYGAQATYLMLAVLVGISLVPATLAIRDYPPGASATHAPTSAGELPDTLRVGEIVRRPAFWALAAASGIVTTSIMVLTFNMIQLAESLGIDRDQGALLQSTMAFAGMAGSIIFGWVADRLGGARGLALLAFNMAILFALLLLDLPFAALAVVIALFGLHGAGMIPNLSRALAHSLGQGSFSRAFGLVHAVGVPFTMTGVMAMAAVYTQTGTYAPAILAFALLLVLVIPLALSTRGTPKVVSPA
jgi:MFS family permease